MELTETKAAEDAFLKRIIITIREEVTKINPLGELLKLVQTPPHTVPAEKINNIESEEAILDFSTASKGTLIPAFDSAVMANFNRIAIAIFNGSTILRY